MASTSDSKLSSGSHAPCVPSVSVDSSPRRDSSHQKGDVKFTLPVRKRKIVSSVISGFQTEKDESDEDANGNISEGRRKRITHLELE